MIPQNCSRIGVESKIVCTYKDRCKNWVRLSY